MCTQSTTIMVDGPGVVLIAAAVCPHPPLLVPELAAGAAAELDDVRAACDTAVGVLASAEPDLIAVVGGATQAGEFGGSAAGSLAGYGAAWQTGRGAPVLPLSLTIGRWLLERRGLLGVSRPTDRPMARRSQAPAEVELCAVPFDSPAPACTRLGAQIASRARRVALLVMGDGSARRSTKAPGYFDPRAEPYDTAVANALATGDADQLAKLDPGLSSELMAAGRAAWQVLAGAAADGAFRARLHLAAAPYGVGYFVVSWTAPAH
jgi:hypothetical protein